MDESASSTPKSANAPSTAPVARSVGERLRAGRERAGLSIPAAAEKLHLDPKVIEALEADRFAELGASVYVRGHLKRYAEFVGETALELVNMYNARETRQAPPDLTQVPHPERRADPRRLLTPLVVVGCAGVLLGAVWWVLSGTRATTPALAETPRPLVPGDAAPMASVSASLNATPASLTSTTPASSATVIERTPGQGRAGSATAPETAAQPRREPDAQEAAAPARETSLRLELTNDSWVEVYDSRGQRLFYDVASAGSVQSVIGRGPLRVVLGNAAGVSVEVDGQPREIPAAAADGEGASFVVNRSGSLSRAR
jgi:cytoskeleton protein RodZ